MKYLLISVMIMVAAATCLRAISRTVDISQNKMIITLEIELDEDNNIVSGSYMADLVISYNIEGQVIKQIKHEVGNLEDKKSSRLKNFIKEIKDKLDIK